MALSDITDATAVRQAADEFDVLGREGFLARYGFGRAREYFLLLGGKRYDSKAIMGAAHGYQFPGKGPLRAADFSGGDATVKTKLEELGFSVESPAETSAGSQSRRTSSSLQIGAVYTREQLRELFGITDATLNTGLFQPRGYSSLWIFLTEQKTPDRTPYVNRLEGDTLYFQSQTQGRKDDLVINHKERGLELLAFYRKEKYEFPGAGFRYEGPFRYDRREGGRPANFVLQRVRDGSQVEPVAASERRLDTDNLDLHKIAEELNTRAQHHPIGGLQAMRAELKSLTRRPGHLIFSSASTTEEFAFHHGGRRELQFNIGFETVAGVRQFRHGIAFSFEPSRSMPIVDELFPKVSRFNDFLRQDLESFTDLRMWHFDQGKRSGDYLPGPIASELARKGVFVFLGKRQRADQPIDYESALLNLDRLLPLYRYVECPGQSKAFQAVQFTFRPGCSIKAASTSCTQAELQLDIALRHNEIQRALYEKLARQYGEENVGTECPSFAGTRVDVVVRDGASWSYYEIKTSHSPRACIREAVGQLLEYSFWPGCQSATRLVVVGETPLDDDGAAYLARLKEEFALPLEYESIAIPSPNAT